MEQETKVLENLLSSMDMGIHASEEVMKHIEDEKLKRILIDQIRAYKALKIEVADLMDIPLEKKTLFENTMIKSMIKMKSFINQDDRKIAKMLIEGNNQACMSMHSLLNENPNMDKEVRMLCEQFLHLTQEHSHQWNEFL